MYDQGVVLVVVCHQKRMDGKYFPREYQMTVNRHYLCHPYYRDVWCFDIIQMMLKYFHPQRHQKQFCVRFVYKYQNVVV